jgi:hypothetical protein
MVSFPENEIVKVNEMLHQLLGYDFISVSIGDHHLSFQGEDFLGLPISDQAVRNLSKEETLQMVKGMSDDKYLKLYRFLNFYYPRWLAYNVIKDSNDEYASFSSNNELLLSITSIVDSISPVRENWITRLVGRGNQGYTKRFIDFIKNNLSEAEVMKVSTNYKVVKGRKLKNINNLKDFAKYIYKIRSLVVHEAELGGIYPYNTSFTINFEAGKLEDSVAMITPDQFRRLLWKAIFNYLGLKIIY